MPSVKTLLSTRGFYRYVEDYIRISRPLLTSGTGALCSYLPFPTGTMPFAKRWLISACPWWDPASILSLQLQEKYPRNSYTFH